MGKPSRRDLMLSGTRLLERGEFELAVPVSKLPDDSVLLQFATLRRVALMIQNSMPVRRYCRNLEGKRPPRTACSEYVSVPAFDGQLSEI
jgi:hypothetical protein